jgi:sugar lactone lactonase YvrE
MRMDFSNSRLDSSGKFYFSDLNNGRIRKVDTNGMTTTIAGTGVCTSTGDGGLTINATVRSPVALAVDPSGNLFFGEDATAKIRRINTSGTITTIAGTGTCGYTGDRGPATSAQIGRSGLAADASGNIYFADYNSNRIRNVDTSGIITTIAGGRSRLGDCGLATSANLSGPWGIATDPSGNLFIADQGHYRIRKI